MSHTVVQIHQLPHFPEPHQSPLHKCERRQPCKQSIKIPNELNMSTSASDDDNVYVSPNPELPSFVSIDGDYDDEETPNVIVVECGFVGSGIATAPPLDDDYIVACENKPNMMPQTSTSYNEGGVGGCSSPPTEEEVCIICYDKIEETRGNFQTNFCDTCKYSLHNSCIEEYIIQKLKDDVQIQQTRFIGIKCLICSKVVERAELTQEEFDEINNSGDIMNHHDGITPQQRRDIQLHQHALHVMERQLRRDRRNNNKRFVCHVCFILCLILCAGGVLASIITKNK
jgi:hypothetical protein